MNTTEPQASSSTTLTTMKIHPPLLAGALLLVTLVLHFMLPRSARSGWYQSIGLLVVAAGAECRVSRPRFSGARDDQKPWGEPTAFVVQPPYTWTRNPMYLGLATSLFGLAIFFTSIVMLIRRRCSSR